MSRSTEADLMVSTRPIPPAPPQDRKRRNPADLLICSGFALFALWLTIGLWPHPDTRTLALNPADQVLVEWFLSYGGRFWNGDFSLISDRLNAPDGINMLVNAATVGLGVIFAPITKIFGVATTFAVLMSLNLALTAIGWYLLFAKTFRVARFSAAVGAFFCGFAPGMVSQANSHLHMTAQWLVPPMIWCVVTLARLATRRDTAWRIIGTGAAFGLLVAAQVFIGEETLFLTALTLAIVTVAYLAWRRPPLIHFARFSAGLLTAVAVSIPLLAYPLWVQFKGPQSVPNGVFSPDYFIADLASFVAISPLSLFGSAEATRLSTGPAEYNTFFGWPLVLLFAVLTIWLSREAIAVACALAALALAALSLGPMIVVNRQPTGLEGPYQMLKGVPVIDGALPLRFALAAIPLVAVLLVLGLEKARQSSLPSIFWGVPAAVVLALIPILPAQLPTTDRAAVPAFYAEGHWRQCASDGDVIVPVPVATPGQPEPMRFAADQNVAFGMPEGFFIGPYGRYGRATIGTWKRPTSALLAEVAKTGKEPLVDNNMRAQAKVDLTRWKAKCVVLTEHPHHDALLHTLEALLGPGKPVSDAVIWRL
ncbi:MAG TPA: hypothetical protein VFC19_20025 [Candidatus Limnocylindrales bacterium]|nr:hypothetical protein [Candidatus Limnocylindrales bacterium]